MAGRDGLPAAVNKWLQPGEGKTTCLARANRPSAQNGAGPADTNGTLVGFFVDDRDMDDRSIFTATYSPQHIHRNKFVVPKRQIIRYLRLHLAQFMRPDLFLANMVRHVEFFWPNL